MYVFFVFFLKLTKYVFVDLPFCLINYMLYMYIYVLGNVKCEYLKNMNYGKYFYLIYELIKFKYSTYVVY